MPFSVASFDLFCLLHELALQITLQNDWHFGSKYVSWVVSASCRQTLRLLGAGNRGQSPLQRLSRLGYLADGAYLLPHRLPQPALSPCRLDLDLFHLHPRRPPHHRRPTPPRLARLDRFWIRRCGGESHLQTRRVGNSTFLMPISVSLPAVEAV